MAKIYDRSGKLVEVPLHVQMYREAADQKISFEQYCNQNFDTDPDKYGSAFNQLLASEGMQVKPSKEYGLNPKSMDEILNPKAASGTVVKEAVPASRILFPAAILSAIEDKLSVDLETTPNAFEGMIAVDDTIQGDRFERPILNYSKPEAGRHQVISQLALPNTLLTITASDTVRKIPTFSLGMEISEQAMKASTLDLVGLALARQAAVERNERAMNYMTFLYNGDADMGQGDLSAKLKRANEFDSTVTTAGTISQKAWIKWLNLNHTKRRISHIVCDLDFAMALENRTGKPIITGDNPNSVRIDAIPSVLNPSWDFNTKIFLTQDPNWPANRAMGIDSRYAIHRVKSLSAAYEAIENLVMRRATQMRFDFGEIVYRLYDDAFEVLSLDLS